MLIAQKTNAAFNSVPRAQLALPLLRETKDYLNQAYGDFRNGKFGSAIATLDMVLRLDQKNEYALYLRSGCLQKEGRLADALTDVLALISLNPNHPKAFWQAGYLYGKAKRHGKAIECYSRYLEIKEDWQVLYNLGCCYKAIGDQKKAAECFHKALQIKNAQTYAPDAILDLPIELGFGSTGYFLVYDSVFNLRKDDAVNVSKADRLISELGRHLMALEMGSKDARMLDRVESIISELIDLPGFIPDLTELRKIERAIDCLESMHPFHWFDLRERLGPLFEELHALDKVRDNPESVLHGKLDVPIEYNPDEFKERFKPRHWDAPSEGNFW